MQNVVISVSLPCTKMNSVLVLCHKTKMTFHFLLELELHGHAACPSQVHVHQLPSGRIHCLPVCLRRNSAEMPNDIGDLLPFVSAPHQQIFMDRLTVKKREREQLPFSTTVLTKHSLSRKSNEQSQQAMWGLNPWIHRKGSERFHDWMGKKP